MSMLKDYIIDETESLSLGELSFALETIDDDLKVAFSVLETHDKVTDHIAEHGLESINDTALVKWFPNLESKRNPNASILMGFWDDWFTTRHRLIQGIVDLLRKKEKTIGAYRRKLRSKQFAIAKNELASYNRLHEATFISMEKYWLYPNGSHPEDIVEAVKKDFKDTSTFLEGVPHAVESSFKDLHNVIKRASRESVMDTLDRHSTQLKSPVELVPGMEPNATSRYLYRTALIIGNTERPEGNSFERLATPVEIRVISGGWGSDVVNGILTTINGILRPAILSPLGLVTMVRSIISEPFSLTSDEVIELHQYGSMYLESAEEGIARARTSLNKIDTHSKEIKGLLDEQNIDMETSRLLARYMANLTKLVEKPFSDITNRQIKMAKGINYILMRTVSRGR